MATCALALLGTILFLSACISPAGHEPACGDNFQLSVSSGLTPEVSWTPNCTIYQLTIDSAPPPPPSGPAHFVWFLDSSLNDLGLPTNRISSPVNYSSRPSGVVVRTEPRPLVHGVHYRLTLVVYSNDGLFETHQLDFDP